MSDSQRDRIRELTARQTFLLREVERHREDCRNMDKAHVAALEEVKRLKWLLGNANDRIFQLEEWFEMADRCIEGMDADLREHE